jgi:peptidoglycan/LPS O-acetylase OafA/YrhL
MAGAQRARGPGPDARPAPAGRRWLVALAVLGLALLAAWVPLTYLTRDLQASRDGVAVAFAVVGGLVGILVARRQPRNPEGWLMLVPAVCAVALFDSGLYAVLD